MQGQLWERIQSISVFKNLDRTGSQPGVSPVVFRWNDEVSWKFLTDEFQHWRGVPGTFGLEGAWMLEFVPRSFY